MWNFPCHLELMLEKEIFRPAAHAVGAPSWHGTAWRVVPIPEAPRGWGFGRVDSCGAPAGLGYSNSHTMEAAAAVHAGLKEGCAYVQQDRICQLLEFFI